MTRAVKSIALIFFASLLSSGVRAGDDRAAARATNEFGLDLYRKLATAEENLCLSPYSIESALAMTFAGADGETRHEMARVLHFADESDAIHESFASLRNSLDEMTQKTERIAQESKKKGGPSEPITLAIANRLFAQRSYNFRDSFRQLAQKFYGAPFELLDFRKDADGARRHINNWVAEETRNRIRDLIPEGGVDALTRLVLTNALYLKAPWQSEFHAANTKPQPFHVRGGAAVDVPTMHQQRQSGYTKQNGFSVVALPYSSGELQFVILLPDNANELPVLEKKLDANMLAMCARLESHELDLSMPKFKLEPPTIALASLLEGLGMKTALDLPQGSANFDRMASRKPNDYLAISKVFHKTFVALDEKGTEAAAATAVVMMEVSAARIEKPPPIVVKVDRPFLYAIQHVPSGVCLFLGRVTDPR
jgi:serpin B